MTKAEIVEAIATKKDLSTPLVAAVIDEFMVTVKQSMADGNNIYLRGFGTFLLKKRAEKAARNIVKGTSITVPAHIVPVFKPSSEFVNEVKTKAKI
jgi:DNA-binding protein HU-beta